MRDWRSELDALVAEAMAFARSLKVEIDQAPASTEKSRQRAVLSVPDHGDSERDQIRKRVERFKAHQERFMREREEHANSVLHRIRQITKCKKSSLNEPS